MTQWSKEKTADWVVILGEKDSGQVLSVNHLTAVQGDRVMRMNFVTPDKRGRCYISLFVMSDCFLGIDQELQIRADLQ